MHIRRKANTSLGTFLFENAHLDQKKEELYQLWSARQRRLKTTRASHKQQENVRRSKGRRCEDLLIRILELDWIYLWLSCIENFFPVVFFLLRGRTIVYFFCDCVKF